MDKRYVNRPRLRDFDYRGAYAYHLTLVTDYRAPVLVGDTAGWVVGFLDESAKTSRFEVLAYCAMPDHLHVLGQGVSDESDAIRFIQRFKQMSGFYYKRASGARLWQESFHDRALRRVEDLNSIARYIADNPVRAGLIDDALRWPYTGGLLLTDMVS
jgi:REP element-mobilizing transposase RayT